MPDTLTTEERAAIDRAVAAGRVQKIPRGQSAYAVEYDQKTGYLRYTSTGANPSWHNSIQRGARKAQRAAGPRPKKSRPLDPKVQQEIAAIKDMATAGAHWGEVEAAFPHLKESQITYRLKATGSTLAPRPRPHEVRRARIAEMVDAGTWTGPQICEALNISRPTLAADLKALGKAVADASRQKRGAATTEARVETITKLAAEGRGRKEIAEATGLAESTIYRIAKDHRIDVPNKAGTAPRPHVEERRARIGELVAEGLTVRQIAERMGRDVKATRKDISVMGLKATPAPKGKHGSGDVASVEKAATQARARDRMQKTVIKDRRRFKTGPVAGGTYQRTAPQEAKETLFPNMRRQPGEEVVLKDGANSQKIGGDVLVGHLRGAKIFTLTLEERATCPTTCAHWRGCYGNGMNRAPRFAHGAALQKAIREEVAAHCKRHALVLIRTHVLGDFYSSGYVSMWSDLLAQHPNLTVFGFTAWRVGTKIGDAIASVRAVYPRRFMIRESGRTGTWGSFTITDPLPEKTIGDAVVCPEQRETNLGETNRHCGNCAVCWSTDAPVAFIKH